MDQTLQPTIAAAQSDIPAVDPSFYLVAFRDTDQIANSGGLYRKVANEPPHAGKFQNGNGTWYELSGNIFYVTQFGLKPTSSGSANLVAVKQAIAATPYNGRLVFPDMNAVITLDTAGGLSNAPVVDKKLTLQIDAHLKMSVAFPDDVTNNPSFLLAITADNVTVCGSGTLEGSGFTTTKPLSGNDPAYPGLVRATGKYLTWSGVRLLKAPQIGIMYRGGLSGVFQDFIVEGGHTNYQFIVILNPADPNFGKPNPLYDGSYHVGIACPGSHRSVFRNIQFIKGGDGGAVAQGIFSAGAGGSADYLRVEGCFAEDPWEKLFYGYGNYHYVSGNAVVGTFNAYQRSAFTDVFRLMGTGTRLVNNTTVNVRAGVQILDAHANVVEGNVFLNCSHIAIVANQVDTGTVAHTKVIGNYVTANPIVTNVSAGIYAYTTKVDLIGIEIRNNLVQGFSGIPSVGSIHIGAASGLGVYHAQVSGNYVISSAGSGIKIQRAIQGAVSDNEIRMAGIGIEVSACSRLAVNENKGTLIANYTLTCDDGSSSMSFSNNVMFGASNKNIRGFTFGSANNSAIGNQWTDTPLVGTAALAANATTTVPHGGVASHATVNLFSVSGTFQAIADVSGFYTGPNGNDFNVVRANGVAPAGGEAFRYQVIQ